MLLKSHDSTALTKILRRSFLKSRMVESKIDPSRFLLCFPSPIKKEQLRYWLFEKNIATVWFAEYGKETVGYALYYPVFGSFAAAGSVYLEDFYLKEEFRGLTSALSSDSASPPSKRSVFPVRHRFLRQNTPSYKSSSPMGRCRASTTKHIGNIFPCAGRKASGRRKIRSW